MNIAGFNVRLLPNGVVDSTNNEAKQLINSGSIDEGAVIIAESQTEGKGRHQRKWHSPKGGLYLTVVLKPKNLDRVTDISILAGTALAQAVENLMPKRTDVSVKWPNDCLLSWKKVGGVLCETLLAREAMYCLVGIGLNVNLSKEDLRGIGDRVFPPTSLSIESPGSAFELKRIMEVVIAKLFHMYQFYLSEGFDSIRFLWERKCHLIGRRVEFTYQGTDSKTHKIAGNVLGIDDRGAIVLSTEGGERQLFSSGEITCFWP